MYKEKVFEEIRSELIMRFQQIDLSDFNRYHDWAKPHYRILQELANLSELTIETREDLPKKEIISEEVSVVENNVVESNFNYPIGSIFTISKKASGAVIEGLNYPIPEVLVREIGIENGNKVKITGTKGYFENGDTKWDFEIVDRSTVPAPGLVEIKQGIVSKVGHMLVVSETISSNIILLDGTPINLYINETDSFKYRIKEGDIIDGRFYENNVVGSFRINYKYETEELAPEQSIESRKLQYRKNNNTKTEAGTNMLDRLDKQALLNRNIVLVGLEGRINDFSNHLKGFGGINLIHLTGDESKISMRSTIKKSDYVLISTFENSHDASKFVAKTCKELNIPCTYTHSDGLFSVLNDAIELIKCVESA